MVITRTESTALDSREVAAGELVRPVWRRGRAWAVLALAVVIGALAVVAVSGQPGRADDPSSTGSAGSKALAEVLAGYGARVRSTDSLATAVAAGSESSVLVLSPDDYSTAQLRRLITHNGQVVLVQPGTRSTTVAVPGASPDPERSPRAAPGCTAGAGAAGDVDWPSDTGVYDAGPDAQRCYGGALVLAGPVALLGSADVLRNDHLDQDGVAALDVNVLTADRTLGTVVWLRAGSDAAGPGPSSIWELFPGGAYRAFWWLVAVGVLAVLWRARRLGGVVREPLPVIVRSAELVEGHGRLYLRAGARDRAAAALRAAAFGRIVARRGLPRAVSVAQVAPALAVDVGRSPAEVITLLAGPAPADDAALVRLARELDELEAAIGRRTEGG